MIAVLLEEAEELEPLVDERNSETKNWKRTNVLTCADVAVSKSKRVNWGISQAIRELIQNMCDAIIRVYHIPEGAKTFTWTTIPSPNGLPHSLKLLW